jgi:hypothetical protein
MTDFTPIAMAGVVASVALVAGGYLLARSSGAAVGAGRRLAGAREYRVGEVVDLDPPPGRPLRVAGRIRCGDPIVTARDDRLVALHRDVDVQLADGGWRTIERLRSSRRFELWDHDGSLSLDAAEAAEPLITLPHVWRGGVEELTDEAHRAAVARLTAEGLAPIGARSVTRMVSVVERLLVLARVERSVEGQAALAPPAGGYLVSTLDLPDAMRVLGGPRRGRLLVGASLMAAGSVLALASLLAWLVLG